MSVMEWYFPITILPGIGMIIMSTVSQIVSLSTEIEKFLNSPCNKFQSEIAEKKIKQLGLLTRASVLLYISAGFYVLSGILAVFFHEVENEHIPSYVLILGSFFFFVAITLLILFAFKAVGIRRTQFKYNQEKNLANPKSMD
ncbi:hypothetical protein [Sediminitomix flava]|uniref:DUF2721 domain-containing protein n=1 Tax=Sediminitomix flava TaxID=379075 RepID=A0A315ZX26_SEDFL|nr:hypothetical protein [Sediminitomix flava]PWJ41877.1 hypothetical protein BC781_103127 [Sediminitomix flava]